MYKQSTLEDTYELGSVTTHPMYGTILFVAHYKDAVAVRTREFPYEDMRVVEVAPSAQPRIRIETTKIEASGLHRLLTLGARRRSTTVFELMLPKESELLTRVRKADQDYIFMQMQRGAALAAMTSS